MKACMACLERSGVIGALAGRIENATAGRRRLPELMALDNERLAASVGLDRPPSVDAGAIATAAARLGIEHCCVHSDCYPRQLLDARDRSAALFMRGDARLLNHLGGSASVAIVGARSASPYGLEVARRLASDLARCGVLVVSGMAFGIDGAAHTGALDVGGRTVAVLGSGVDVPYPKAHEALYRRIAEQGLVLSEFPPGLRPRRWCFPARNRIMAALTRMTIVVEGRTDSGSLISAGFAQDLGRDVGAVPGPITRELSAGPNDLLADGALLVRGAGDVLDALFGPGAVGLDNPQLELAPRLEPALERLHDAIVASGGATVEELTSTAGGTVADQLAGLSELELRGLVRCGPGGRYVAQG